MDHNWGRTISEMGVGGGTVTRAARNSMFPHVVYTNGHPFDPTKRRTWFTSLGTDLPYGWSDITWSPAFGNFPYGFPAEPDFPL